MRPIRMMAAALAIVLAFAAPVRAEDSSPAAESESESKVSLEVLKPVEKSSLAKDVSEEGIGLRDYPRTTITGLETPEDMKGLLIRSSSPISRVDKLLLDDNRLVLDIARADCALDAVYEMDDPVIGSVRAEGVELFGLPGTRVVLELKKGVRYSVYLTPDRTGVVVRFQVNEIIKVGFRALEESDIITVQGEYCPALNVFPVGNPDEILIDLPIAELKEQSKWVTGDQFNFIKSVTTTQLDPETARITLKVTGELGIVVSYEGTVATVKFSQAEYRNIYYDAQTKTLGIRKKEGRQMSAKDANLFDNYSNLAGVLTLPGDFSDWLGYGEMMINDGFLKNISIGKNGSGQTQLSMHEERILAFSVYDDTAYLYVKIQLPQDAYERIVVIDPGHGGSDPGARANGLVEKEMNLDVTKRLIEILEKDGRVKAYATRTVDQAVDLYDRPAWASKLGDLFVSIHMNAMSNNTVAKGTEVFWYPHPNDEKLGFSSRPMADIFQSTLLSELGTVDRKVQSKRFVVIRYTTIPAVLCEIGFLTNKEEAGRIATPEYRQRTAEALSRAIYKTFTAYTPKRG
ncbi:MAG: N-acetylmuramoyl-L-alanine amidase [Clostridiales bacterium]|jgi:N-acetylmuramoyl-L-alanine amidase|nr:N-acetylmuramoyl-L-alanine amidase [Clostridiales bacterium]